MKVFWLNAALCFRADTEQESKWLSEFSRMLEEGRLTFEIGTPCVTRPDHNKAVSVFKDW